jgi:predicted homoserine dehydrogenase-like protein
MTPTELLPSRLRRRIEAAGPIRVGLIGAGKFGSMFLAQAPTSPHIDVVAIADLDTERAKTACRNVGWSEERVGRTRFVEDGIAMIAEPDIEVVIEATGNPLAGVRHALAASAEGKHIVMVNVEADVLAGPYLAAQARSAGTVYSMAYGDQPALVCEMVDWARACGFPVVAAGKGTRYQPAYHGLTPANVWDQYGLTAEQAAEAGMNAQMFCSFMDGTKSGIEMAAIANATGLAVPENGLAFPPCSMDELQSVLRPRDAGGVLEGSGVVEVVSSMRRDGNEDMDRHLRWGVYVVFEGPSDYARACFAQYGMRTDSPAATPRSTGPITSSAWSLPCRSSARPSTASRPARPKPGAAMSWRWPSATWSPARCWMGRAGSRCGASSCRRRAAASSTHCRSGSPMGSRSSARCSKATSSPPATSATAPPMPPSWRAPKWSACSAEAYTPQLSLPASCRQSMISEFA